MSGILKLTAGVLVAGLVVIGCDKAEDTAAGAAAKMEKAMDTAGKTAADAGQTVTDKAKEVSADLTAQAQKLIDQAQAYIKEGKFDLADEAIKKLEALKDKLPAEWTAKIDSAKQMLETAKKGMGNMMPAGNR